jgi:hypothetical protein
MPASSKDKARPTYRDAVLDIDAGSALVRAPSGLSRLTATRISVRQRLETIRTTGAVEALALELAGKS